ncbi:PH domain-containing protein [uncultured Mucilaginibacter sp.]|uniref:PH domain-containing protein n=1 Tax=uncultured Mucilaginibacter sp. TaxID=797541 RepID=UPI0025F7188B|nr:PH domain-containing protein [uncultured Mucilaginibacter sp.]
MATTFRSKIGLELVIPLGVVFIATSVPMVMDGLWSGFIVIGVVALFTAHMLYSTYYVVNNSIVNIRCGFLVNQNVDIDTIKSIKETNNALSSPASSLDRLEIAYNKYDSVMISPKDKAGFIALIQSVKPDVEVMLKAK